MMKHSKWVLATGLLSMVVLFGCDRPKSRTPAKNNLRYVKCNKRLPNFSGVTEILVSAKDDYKDYGIAYDDEIVFVCTGEKVHWKADQSVKTMEISFLNGEWPFKEPFEPELAGTSQTYTPDREVKELPQKLRGKAYKYKLHVVTDTGKIIDVDPVIWPMDD
jgi:hypothetical protein